MLFRRVAMMLSLAACLMSPAAANGQPEVPALDEGTSAVEPGNGATAKFAASLQPPAIMSAAPGWRAEQWRERRYGGTMFLVDVSAATIGAIVQASTGSDIGAGIFVGGYFLSGAITHAYHGNWGTAESDLTGRRALALIPPGASVLAQGQIAPHLSHRRLLYVLQMTVEIPDSDASRTVVIPNVFLGDHQVGVSFQGVF